MSATTTTSLGEPSSGRLSFHEVTKWRRYPGPAEPGDATPRIGRCTSKGRRRPQSSHCAREDLTAADALPPLLPHPPFPSRHRCPSPLLISIQMFSVLLLNMFSCRRSFPSQAKTKRRSGNRMWRYVMHSSRRLEISFRTSHTLSGLNGGI